MRNMCKQFGVKHFSFIIFLFLSCSFLFGQELSYPESSEVRSKLVATWFIQDISLLREQSTEILQNELGEYFLIRAEEKDGLMEIILAPLELQTLAVQDFDLVDGENIAKPTYSSASLTIETWPKDGYGSWILYRDLETDKNVRLRHYFMNDKNVYLEFFPGREKSYVNLSIYGALVALNVPVPVSFEYFYTVSLADIKTLTKNTLPWQYVELDDTIYSDTIQMVYTIRKYLPDAQKSNMFVSDTSEYDFLRWIIDGLIKPLTGGTLFIDPLFVPTIEPDFMIPERQNTHKSYDYVRNLAAAAISAGSSLPYTYENSNADVKQELFSVMVDETGVRKRVNFVTDVGYQVSVLKPLLYLLTATENDLFYLGAVRELKESTFSGRNSEQYYYTNAVAFFSWFDSNGTFQVSVFENGAEFTLDQFLERYKDSFVYLVRVKPSANFFPEVPIVPEEPVLETVQP